MVPPPSVRPRKLVILSSEPPNRPTDSRLSITMPVTALSSRAPAVRTEPLITGLLKLPEMSAPIAAGPDRSSNSIPVSRHKRVGRAVIADLRLHRRPRQPLAEAARPADPGHPPLRPADRPALARRDRAEGGVAAREARIDADIDRPRGQHQPRPGQPAHAQVHLARRRRLGRGRAVADRPRSDSAKAELRIEDVHDRERHRFEPRIDLGPRPEQTGEAGIAAGVAESGRRQPPALLAPAQRGGRHQFQRPPVERPRAGHPVAVRRDLDLGIEGEVPPARARHPRPDRAVPPAQAGARVDIGDRERPPAHPPRHHPPLDRGPRRIEQDHAR